MPVNAPVTMEAAPPNVARVAAEMAKNAAPRTPEQMARDGGVKGTLTAEQTLAQELRQFQAKEQTKGDMFAEVRARNTRSLDATELKHLETVNPTAASEARQFTTYTDVMREAARTNTDPAKIAEQKGLKDFAQLRTDVVGRMMQLDVFQAMEGYRSMTPEEQRQFVEDSFATNDRVRAAYFQEMRALSREALNLPEDPAARSRGEQSARTAENNVFKTVAVKDLRAKLGSLGTELSDAEIDALFAGGTSPEAARMELFNTLLDKSGVDSNAVRQRDVLRAQAKTAQEQLNLVDAQLKSKPTNEAELQAKKAGLEATLKRTNEQLSTIKPSPEDEQKITEVNNAVYGVDDIRAGVRVGGVYDELRAISQRMKVESQTNPSSDELSADDKALQQKREQLVRDLSERMGGALGKSVENVWMEGIDEVRDIMQRKALAETAGKEKAEMTLKDNALVRLAEQQDHNWIGMDRKSGRRTVNYEGIGHDVRYGGNGGLEAVKRLQLRDLMMGGEGAIIKMQDPSGGELRMNADGKLVKTDGSEYRITVTVHEGDQYVQKEQTATWENIPYDQLPEEGRKVLESVFDQTKNDYVTRMFMDLEQARHPHSLKEGWNILGNLRELNLSRDEITKAHTMLGDLVVEGIQQGKYGDQVLEKLRGMGIDATDAGKKGLIPLLLMLIGLLGSFAKKEM